MLSLAPAASNAQNNTAYGVGALKSGTTAGLNDSAFGVSALFANTTGADNTATGDNALMANRTGAYNTASGQAALKANTTGTGNTATGAQALWNCTTDGQNTATGFQALFSDTIGFGGLPNQNVAEGYQALYSSTDGFENGGPPGTGRSITAPKGTRTRRSVMRHSSALRPGWAILGLVTMPGSRTITGSANIDIGHPGVAGDSRIIRIGDGVTQTATYLTGVIHGNGAGLTGVSVPATAVTGTIPGSKIAAGSVTGTQLGAGERDRCETCQRRGG